MENVSRAVIVPFFNYGYGESTLLWRFFQLHMKQWIKYVSRVYVIDSGCGIHIDNTLPELTDGKITVITKPAQSHWQNFNEAIRQVPETHICLMDSDMIIYRPEIMDQFFREVEGFVDIATIMDSSGGMYLGDKFPVMKENEFRFERRRFAPYLSFLKKSILRADFDFTPRGGDNWTDSMGTVTEQILEDTRNILELPDDRSTIYLEDDGRITSTQWLDTPPKFWALKENPDYGYYHIRNFGGGLRQFYDPDPLVPGRESRRLLAWFLLVNEKIGAVPPTSLDPDYYQAFKNYHSYLKDL